jgi:hypothetical protein
MADKDSMGRQTPVSRVESAFLKPFDIFSTLLLVGPHVVTRAVAHQGGRKWERFPLPVAFPFGMPMTIVEVHLLTPSGMCQ